jgi:hypothetical protein
MESGLRGGGRSLRRDLRYLEGVSVVFFYVIDLYFHMQVPKNMFSQAFATRP